MPATAVVVPAGEPHGFQSLGDEPLRQVNIHASARILSLWLDAEG